MISKKQFYESRMMQCRRTGKEFVDYLNQQAPVMFFILSREGEIIDANNFAKNLAGADLTGRNIRDLIVDFTGGFNLISLAEEDSEHLLNIVTVSRLPQSLYFTFKRVGEHIMAFGRLDVEDLENMRKEILSLNQELSNLTRELHKKNARLKTLNDEKNRFLGMAAHDLRKPIGLILAYSEFLMDEAENVLSEEHYGFLKTICNSCAFMKRLVDDFLDVSAIEAGRLDLDLKPIAMETILSRSFQLNRIQAAKKGIHLKVQCDSNLPRIIIDEAKIEQVITNLVSNAVEHSHPGSLVTISITHDREMVTVSIKNEGRGISVEEQERLFKPFGKAGGEKTGGEKSTGLGLLISRKIVEAHRGKIWIESRVDQETIVAFNLPVDQNNK